MAWPDPTIRFATVEGEVEAAIRHVVSCETYDAIWTSMREIPKLASLANAVTRLKEAALTTIYRPTINDPHRVMVFQATRPNLGDFDA